jgi:tRNA/rRNA methyltransferase
MSKSFPEETPTPDVRLPIHEHTLFVLVRPHYPENVGAVARAIKTMGFLNLALVKPGRLAGPDHQMARKMAVKSKDVLDRARVAPTLADVVRDRRFVVATTARRGVTGVIEPRALAQEAVERAAAGESIAILFGNEKTGLSEAERQAAQRFVRIPMAANQPSVNLAQATQVIAYELLLAALAERRV